MEISDLFFTFLDILVHMLGIVLAKVIGYMLCAKIYDFLKILFSPYQEEIEKPSELLFDADDKYWKSQSKADENQTEVDEWEDIPNNSDSHNISGTDEEDVDDLIKIMQGKESKYENILRKRSNPILESFRKRQQSKLS